MLQGKQKSYRKWGYILTVLLCVKLSPKSISQPNPHSVVPGSCLGEGSKFCWWWENYPPIQGWWVNFIIIYYDSITYPQNLLQARVTSIVTNFYFIHLLFYWPTAKLRSTSRGNLIYLMLLTAYYYFDPKVNESLATGLGHKGWSRTQWP